MINYAVQCLLFELTKTQQHDGSISDYFAGRLFVRS